MAFRRYFGMITTWYLQSHRTWDRLCHSCIGSSFLAHGAFPEGEAYVVSDGMHAGSLEALWVTRPEAVGLERTKPLRGGVYCPGPKCYARTRLSFSSPRSHRL